MGASNIGSAQAVVADVTPPEGRARGMGAIGAAIGLGFVVGPALGGALTALGATVPFWAALGVALVNALLVWRFLPETRKRREPGTAAQGRAVWRLAQPALSGGGPAGLHQPAVYHCFYGDGDGVSALFAACLWLDGRAEWLYLYLCRGGHRHYAGWTGRATGQT